MNIRNVPQKQYQFVKNSNISNLFYLRLNIQLRKYSNQFYLSLISKIALYHNNTYFATMNQMVFDILNQSQFLNHSNDQRIYYDISQNFQNSFFNPLLSHKLSISIAIAIASNEKNHNLKNILINYALQNSFSQTEINEIQAAVSIMSMNNTLYKFKHYLNLDDYLQKPSGLKMTTKAKPSFGKSTFEILALCISLVNNCEVCTRHHEEKCKELNFTSDEIYAAIQLTSTIKSISMLEFSTQ